MIDPTGAVIAEAGNGDDEVVVADIAAEKVAEVRAKMPVLSHRRLGWPGRKSELTIPS